MTNYRPYMHRPAITISTITLSPGHVISVYIGGNQVELAVSKDGIPTLYSDLPSKPWSEWKGELDEEIS